MAKQRRNPPPWKDEYSDGCTGVFDFWFHDVCVAHDKAYDAGGTIEDKLVADGQLHEDMCSTPGIGGWLARRGWADIRYAGVRATTYNYPPGHKQRHGLRVEAFNWMGPGPNGRA